MPRDCPDAALNPLDQCWIGNDWSPGRSSQDAQSPQSGVNMVTLCLTQDATVDYRLNKNSGPVNPLKFVPTHTSTNVQVGVNIEENIIEVNKLPILNKPVMQIKRKAKSRSSRSSAKRKGGEKKQKLQTVMLMICP